MKLEAGPSNRFQVMTQDEPNNSKDMSPKMILKRVMKSTSPYLVHKQKKARAESASESLAVALKSVPSVSTRYDQPDHSSTPVSTKTERLSHSTISSVERTNGNHSTAQAEVPKLMIKLKPILPKATQSGFPFIFTNSDSDHSEPVSGISQWNYFSIHHPFHYTWFPLRSEVEVLQLPVQNRIRSMHASKVR